MREKIRDKGRLEHILEAIDNLFEFTEGVSREDYQSNKILYFAIIKNLEIIGEASYKLTKELKEKYSEVEWQVIIDLRHILVHGYYQISSKEIWYIIQNDLQPLKMQIQAIYECEI
ncbi:MAG: DUF86 domain-containing protein [Dysgonamonadaceae bacterium]|jgi:uncharacterized protein with HEPN domain|nr:DUF86 domain-containing protein [Dysgonamonadaceae bacterium]